MAEIITTVPNLVNGKDTVTAEQIMNTMHTAITAYNASEAAKNSASASATSSANSASQSAQSASLAQTAVNSQYEAAARAENAEKRAASAAQEAATAEENAKDAQVAAEAAQTKAEVAYGNAMQIVQKANNGEFNGRSIKNVSLVGTHDSGNGASNKYNITDDKGATVGSFRVYNGSGIDDVRYLKSEGLVDTYEVVLSERFENNPTFTVTNGAKGKDGTSVSVTSTLTEFTASQYGGSIPNSGWSTTFPSVGQGMFLWTRTTVTFSDGKSSVSYSVARQGRDGTNGIDGAGVQKLFDYTSTAYGYSMGEYLEDLVEKATYLFVIYDSTAAFENRRTGFAIATAVSDIALSGSYFIGTEQGNFDSDYSDGYYAFPKPVKAIYRLT